MPLVLKDRVKETTSTTGTGTLTLTGASSGFQSFSSALSDGDTTYYSIYETSTDSFEVGIGTFTLSGTTLSRDTVLESSNSNSLVNLTSGSADVFITYPAEKSVHFNADGDIDLNRDPQTALQAATKQYVDTIAAAGLHYHDPVRVEKEGNLSATYNNGTAGVGATLTNNSTQAALAIDGVTLSLNDRVLVYEQTDATQNGIYTVTDTGSASTNWVLTRATDADSYAPSDPDSLGQGDAFFVLEGAAGAGELYVMNTEGTITFGTTNITFTQVASTAVYAAGDGLTLTGTTFAVGAGTGVTVNTNDIAIGQDVSTSANVTFSSATINGNITVTGTVDGRDVATDGTKLDGIESGATADQTASEIKTAYESNADTNAFTDAEKTKLSGIEASADVTDTTNVTAAGALMDSELSNITAVKALDQGVSTTDSPSFVGVTASGTVSFGSISDGTITVTAFVDEDDMVSDSATLVPTQQSVKAYVDNNAGGISTGKAIAMAIVFGG